MTLLTTLADARDELTAVSAVDDAKLLNLIRRASERIDRVFQQRRPLFVPYNETREFLVVGSRVNSVLNTFTFGRPLLALTNVTVGSDVLTVNTQVEAWPTLETPYHKLRLMECCDSWYTFCDNDCDPIQAQINGIWGFHRDYANAWQTVDTLAANVTASATTLTVNDIDAADDFGRTPRISAGNLLRIGTEYLEVTATNTSTNIATVRRGVNGSTAAAHSLGDNVQIWLVEEPIRRAVARQAAFMYARRGAFEGATITDIGLVQFPADLLSEVYGIIGGYAYE